MMNDVTQLIGSLGFPILMCFYLIAYVQKTAQAHKDEILSLSENYKQQIQSLVDCLNNNTKALNELKDVIKSKTNYDNSTD